MSVGFIYCSCPQRAAVLIEGSSNIAAWIGLLRFWLFLRSPILSADSSRVGRGFLPLVPVMTGFSRWRPLTKARLRMAQGCIAAPAAGSAPLDGFKSLNMLEIPYRGAAAAVQRKVRAPARDVARL
jgi:hypothetical protein